MAGVTGFALLAIGFVALGLVCALYSISQTRALAVKPTYVLPTFLLEGITIVVAIGLYSAIIVGPTQNRLWTDWKHAELVRRGQLAKVDSEIPRQFHDMPVAMIDTRSQQETWMIEHGQKAQPMVPPEIEAKLRKRERLMVQTPRPSQPDYAEIQTRQKSFSYALPVAWLLSGMMAPLTGRKRRVDESGPETT